MAFNWQEDRDFRADENTANPLRGEQTEAVAVGLDDGYMQAEEEGVMAMRSSPGGGNVPKVAQPLRGNPYNNSDPGMEAGMHVRSRMQVRRLTPRECERLQGFQDDYTMIPWRGRPAEECPDGPRYKALGNSMAVPVMVWIGRRIQTMDDILRGLGRL